MNMMVNHSNMTVHKPQVKEQANRLAPSLPLWKQMKADVLCVFDRDPAAHSLLEVLTTYPGVHAIIMHRISSGLWRRGWHFSARLLAFIARFLTNVDIHPGAKIGQRFFIDHGACVVIGETAEIGNDVTLYHGVTLGGTSWNEGKRHPTLGDGVLVGTGAKILGPITLGNHVRVGANSVVVADVPESSTVVGIPGRIVKNREPGLARNGVIDLDHHLIPDPVGKVMSCLLERLDQLEAQLSETRRQVTQCNPDNEFCEGISDQVRIASGLQSFS